MLIDDHDFGGHVPSLKATGENVGDAELAQELNQLSMKERTAALEDIHGVATSQEEDIDTVTVNLIRMEEELQWHVRANRAHAYQLALTLEPQYVKDRLIRLMFLRADNFDASAAAERFIAFLDFKLELFGKKKLCKDILLEDLSSDDMESLKSGALQELSQCDRAGRAVMIVFQQLRAYKTTENQLKVLFYFGMTLVRNRPEIQKKGTVFLFYNTSSKPIRPNASTAWKLLKLRRALPFKNVSHHFCYRHANTPLATLLPLWWRINPSSRRVRLRKHTGTDMEIRYTLQSFGIPMSVFPVDPDGTIQLTYFQKWLQQRQEIEKLAPRPTPKQLGTTGSQHGPGQNQGMFAYAAAHRSEAPHLVSPAISAEDSQSPTPIEARCFYRMVAESHDDSWQKQTIHRGIQTPFVQDPSDMDGDSSVPPQPASLMETLAQYELQQSTGGMKDQAAQEPTMSRTTPNPQDVLLGRGKPTRNHPGNIRFRELMESHAVEYNQAPKFVKCLIAKKLVQTVTSSGSRFLKPTSSPNLYILVDDKTAQDKVSQFFRSHRTNKTK